MCVCGGFEERMTQAKRKTSGDIESKKVWQQHSALGLYLVIYVVQACCPHVFSLERIHIYVSAQKSLFMLVCKNRVGVSGFGFWDIVLLFHKTHLE